MLQQRLNGMMLVVGNKDRRTGLKLIKPSKDMKFIRNVAGFACKPLIENAVVGRSLALKGSTTRSKARMTLRLKSDYATLRLLARALFIVIIPRINW